MISNESQRIILILEVTLRQRIKHYLIGNASKILKNQFENRTLNKEVMVTLNIVQKEGHFDVINTQIFTSC